MKQGQNDLNFQCCIVCTALANCPRYNIEMNQCPLRVHQLAYCPCNMHPTRTGLFSLYVPTTCLLVCADLKILHLVYLFLCFGPLQFLPHDLGNLRNSVGRSLGV